MFGVPPLLSTVWRSPGKSSWRGRVYVFHLSAGVWSQVANLSAGDAEAADSLGISVASWDPYLVVGASGDDDNGEDAGAVYGFRRLAGGYTEVGKRNAGDGWPHDEYGNSVSIYNGSFAVGSPTPRSAGRPPPAPSTSTTGRTSPGTSSRTASNAATPAVGLRTRPEAG